MTHGLAPGAPTLYTYDKGRTRRVAEVEPDGYTTVEDARTFVNEADLDRYTVDPEETWAAQFRAQPSVVYHATTPERAAAIEADGVLRAGNQTRGIGNRGVGDAVYATEHGSDETYGDAVFAIDLAQIPLADRPQVSREPGAFDRDRRGGLAHSLGLNDYDAPEDTSDGISPDTVVIHGDIPRSAFHRVITKFDETEARDAGGKWTTGGVGGIPPKPPRRSAWTDDNNHLSDDDRLALARTIRAEMQDWRARVGVEVAAGRVTPEAAEAAGWDGVDATGPGSRGRWCEAVSVRTVPGNVRHFRSVVLFHPSTRPPMPRLVSALSLPAALLIALPAMSPRADDPPMRGFTTASAKIQREWEAKFRAIPEPARMREAMRRLAARPHHLGSPYGKDNAEWLKAQFESYGWDARIERFDVLFPTPKVRVLELVAPTRFTAKLEEPILKEDPTTNQRAEQLPTYNAYSGDGDVTAPLVYVNYGVPADYEQLERRGISVKGAIVIARYGGSWRGIKPKVAYEHGAVGALIYSDPRDDGYAEGETYPNGPFRPKDGVQRGSVLDMPTYPGDPLTPGIGASPGAKRLDRKDAITIMKIPVLPISYADAQPLIAALSGPVAPPEWRGGLPITYRLGPGAAQVHLKLEFDWKQTPLYNVIATLKGSTFPDEWVMRGNHHDGWVNGAEDPISGLVAELEEARALGQLVKQGWRPKRTIVYAAWDGEEPSLLGSTEWVEEHMADMRAKGVFYLNTDGNGRGTLGAAGSHAMERFVTEIAGEVMDPESNVTVLQRQRMTEVMGGNADARTARDLRIEALGSGSDFTPFLQHAGVPTLNIGFGGEDGGGIYHSIYDSFAWYTRFSDTSFVYGRALSQVAGMMVMRVANADLLPAEFQSLSATAKRYLGEVTTLRETTAKEIDELNRRLAEGAYTITNDPRRPLQAPKGQAAAPYLNFAPIQNATDSLARVAERFEKAYGGLPGSVASSAALAQVNALLRQSDQVLLIPDGLPKRPWYQHALYAPGYYTGYGVKTMPGVREAIEQREWKLADEQITKLSAALLRESDLIARAAQLLEQATQVKPIP